MKDRRLFWFSCYDLEPLKAKSPSCGGPETWAESEAKILEITGVFRDRGVPQACLLNATPEAAKAHADLLRSLDAEGFHIAIQPNVPGFRYPTYDKKLGQYPPDEQREIIKLALSDWEDALGLTTTTYTPCCGSRSNETHAILAELGFRQVRMPAPGRFDPEWPDRCTMGVFPAPFHASAKHRLLAGDLPLLVFPNAGDKTGRYARRPGYPADLRGEYEVGERTWEMYRDIIDTHLELLIMLDAPIKWIGTNGHNTARCAIQNVEYAVDYLPQAAEKYGLELVPMGPEEVHAEANKIGGF